MSDLMIVLLGIVLIYMIAPFILTRICNWGVFTKGKSSTGFALTFDDGPDPNYTPELLDLLKSYDAKATFFVLGAKAEKYPELIERMHREGHQIAIHNYVHEANWFMSPWTVRREQIERTADVVERITGERPTYYRPPWGLLNLGDLVLTRKSYRLVLWSVMVGDWRITCSSKELTARLLGKIRPGSIVVLHDSGDTLGADIEAPRQMLEGLGEVMREIQLRGWTCLRTDELLRSRTGDTECAGGPVQKGNPSRKTKYKKGYASTP